MENFKFDERLYTLDVGAVAQHEFPKIIDPNDENLDNGSIVCYEPDKKQTIQLALIIWQVATRERNKYRPSSPYFGLAESRCSAARNALKSLLLPFVEGDTSKARDLCLTLLRLNKEGLEKYLSHWSIIKRPNSIWVNEDSNGIFIAKYRNGIVVGLNPTNCVFVYNQSK